MATSSSLLTDIRAKAHLWTTCLFEGRPVAVEKWFSDGNSAMFLIRRIDGTRELVHESECSRFVL